MARPRKPLLSRDRIVTAALALVDAEGLAAVSTRRLAAELGVSGPSLYNHFRTKDEILDAVADTVVGQVDLSMFATADGDRPDWPEALLAWGRSYRAALTAHPNIVPFLAQGPGRRPAGLRQADAVFGGMVEAGWPPAHATRIGAMMRYFVAGSALGSFARGFVGDPGVYDPADYPHLGQAHLLPEHQRRVDEGAFEAGLRALVDGLALQYQRLRDGEPVT
ncbi:MULTISPECIES: TetR/AcrR family transcriptional regulator [Streptomycetaceae]|uniref:Transcriptional regulator, TetR family n=1 Tax=Streptantibioticus cattleyicolor (strain ATCC 35852 / DSM 46488 / JCM 4925 / NBRC 14057 / NRRL 8057) TaxID=1003195 RepID=F8JX15_STREN|nr:MULTISPECIES: TetR/AcrR family transcriptional regulator [Streptomycetaceae]AEW93284.1 transcriptional regulator, TetR family [Streptantibioticus cattleyicolor NRRL 8057 = DSM 46488]MYS58004.1 TetR family transcriptional regulator [Streptomyces sp. SID5468]CCB73645.1 TetR-family transcriptional regulator [Streptantibioticus cattleyicolor NRRL 8057 = DSM 46488]